MTGPSASPGLLAVDKPAGPTSHDIVDRVRASLGIRRVGHTGTLDPFASGLLLLLVGRATRLAEYLHHPRKRYRAVARLGRATTTDDVEGETLKEDEGEGWRSVRPEEVERALAGFRGSIRQRPPLYSAKKVGGETAYRRARRGESVELPPVDVVVDELTLESFEPPRVTFHVLCSTGTYIRSLARDLGESLGTGAHLEELRRTAVGDVRVEDALPADALDDADRVRAALLPPERALEHLPRARLGEAASRRFMTGGAVEVDGVAAAMEAVDGTAPDGTMVAVLGEEGFLGVGEHRGRSIRPRKVVAGG